MSSTHSKERIENFKNHRTSWKFIARIMEKGKGQPIEVVDVELFNRSILLEILKELQFIVDSKILAPAPCRPARKVTKKRT